MQSYLENGVVPSADMLRSDGKITSCIRDSKVLEKQEGYEFMCFH